MKNPSKAVKVISVRGMPPELRQGMESFANRYGISKSEAYSDAITGLSELIHSGATISSFPASYRASKISVKVPIEVAESADLAIDRSDFPIKKSQFVREACRRFLGRPEEPTVMEVAVVSDSLPPMP